VGSCTEPARGANRDGGNVSEFDRFVVAGLVDVVGLPAGAPLVRPRDDVIPLVPELVPELTSPEPEVWAPAGPIARSTATAARKVVVFARFMDPQRQLSHAVPSSVAIVLASRRKACGEVHFRAAQATPIEARIREELDFVSAGALSPSSSHHRRMAIHAIRSAVLSCCRFRRHHP
jgi:hypothetical protein